MSQNSVDIKIVSDDRRAMSKLIDGKEYRSGESSKEFEDGSELVYEGTQIQKGVGGPEIIEFSLYLGQTAVEGLATHYIINRLKEVDFRIIIEGEEMEPNEETIQSKLEEFKE